jgi:hypothetical protein
MPLITLTVEMTSFAEAAAVLKSLRHVGAHPVLDHGGNAALEMTVRAPSLLDAELYVAHRVCMAAVLSPANDRPAIQLLPSPVWMSC